MYDPFSAVTVGQPSSLMVRITSACRISIARATPGPPAAPNPYAYARPMSTARAPRQSALTTSLPRRMPPSSRTSAWPFDRGDDFGQHPQRARARCRAAVRHGSRRRPRRRRRRSLAARRRRVDALDDNRAVPGVANPAEIGPASRSTTRVHCRRLRTASALHPGGPRSGNFIIPPSPKNPASQRGRASELPDEGSI